MNPSPNANEPIKVIIADDHVLYRAGVKTALSAKKDVTVIAEADNGMHLLNLIKNIKADVLSRPLGLKVNKEINRAILKLD